MPLALSGKLGKALRNLLIALSALQSTTDGCHHHLFNGNINILQRNSARLAARFPI